ncbi:general negative regulator of transcription subunit 4 [Seiridium cupressi]
MAPQDSFIDDEEDTCPLCIEELDIQDKNFYPCPCGYQHNLNGLCPACRRPYDDSSVKFEAVTQEQVADFKANLHKNQKKRAAEQRQKEAQKREITDRTSRKNLVGVRVVQKNLVYVTGLTPTVPEDELLKTLRKHEFFGQYGNIQKISISNRKAPDGQPQSLGIYVTFEKKEDAGRCIAAVNGSHNGDRILRAQLGTTKYCSAWLRNEQCGNRQCMFLHELGDEEDSYTRQDLSSLNSIHTQRPLSNAPGSSRSASRLRGGGSQPPPISQPMARTSSKEGSDLGDGPILPASANWARTTQQRSRRGSHATSGAASSPAISSSLPVTAESAQEAVESTPSPGEPATTPELSTRKLEKQPATVREPKETVHSKPLVKDPFALPDFGDIMKRFMAIPDFTAPRTNEHDDSFPPLFDPLGGYKRRLMREEEEKENNVAEPEEQADKLSEGEPESGSHALGGEPEDRDQESFDQRRNPAPIQRSTTDALFGPSLTSSYAQGAGNIGSVGSRSMTPQQFGRPQGSFADQVPPGLSAPQSSLFQGQGHTRQQSRFSFANENASGSTKVNLAANPRLMAQQTSMMPSSFQSQPGSQFYASSMPGPPPGLKSTGTPPGVGGMFGQGQGFGSGFGAQSKDNATELLRSMFSRGPGSSHAQDTGKREYFSSFQNQYPTSSASSTPAPASGPNVLASLYASQPGAFQDFGPKQKKKGKKHRHANTSSSGGGALVDLADPSILQARMQQHQQQGSNAGVGQGLFGGQSQGGYNPNMMYGAGAGAGAGAGYGRWQAIVIFHTCHSYDDLLPLDEHSVDALVADSDPLDFGGSVFSGCSGTTTPAPPPGLGFPHPHPHPHLPIQFGESTSVLSSPVIQSPAIARPQPAIPLPRPVTPLTPIKAKGASKKAAKADAAVPSSDAKKTIKDLAIEKGLSKDIASQQSQSLKEEDFPALDSVKASSPPKIAPALPSKPVASTKPEKGKKKAEPETTSKAASSKVAATSTAARTEKRPTPGILDIAAATKPVAQAREVGTPIDNKSSAATAASSSHGTKSAVPSALPTLTPTAASVASPVTRAAPKTLRLIQTPKTEQPPSLPSAAVASIRSAAIAAAGHRPSTPASEGISDSTSVISASVSASRTSSPPPSRVGSAALRVTTKSQHRKQRNKLSKEAAAAIADTKPAGQEVEVAPIEGRKKKQKKEKKLKASTTNSPAISRPETPVAESSKDGFSKPEAPVSKPVVSDVRSSRREKPTVAAPEKIIAQGEDTYETETKDAKDALKSPTAVDTSIRLNESTKTTVLTPAYVQPSVEPQQQETIFDGAVGEVPTLSEILQSLIAEGELPDPDDMNLFKPVPNYRAEVERSSAAALPPTVRSVVTKEDEAELNAFRPVRKEINGHRVLLTPNGDFVLNLNEDEEIRYLELQTSIAKTSGEAIAFTAPKHAIPGSGFSLIKGRAVPNGVPAFFPMGPGSFPPDPVGKMHREEAIGCINQHVLPSLNLGSYKTNSAFPSNANSVNLQSLAPWISGATNFMDKDGKRAKMFGGDNWDDMDDFPRHDAEGVPGTPSPAIGSTPLMSVEEAESVLSQAKKQHDATDKKLKAQMLKLRRNLGLH